MRLQPHPLQATQRMDQPSHLSVLAKNGVRPMKYLLAAISFLAPISIGHLWYSLIQLRGCQTRKNTAARNQYAPIREQRCGVSRAPDLHPTGNAERANRRIVDLRGGIFGAAADYQHPPARQQR